MTATSIPNRERIFRALPALLLAAGTLSIAACTAPSPRERAWPEPTGSATPSWVYQPHSWKRLDRIEAWLASPDVRNHPELVGGAHLELAEGRLRFAREEWGTLEAGTMALRIAKSEAAFVRVLDEPLSSSSERDRARRGLTELAGLRGGVVPAGALARGTRATPEAGLRILSRTQWGAKNPNAARLTPSVGRYDRVTVHHSAMGTADLGRASSGEVRDALRKIQLVHMRDKEFGDIGYHYMIDPRGRIWGGRSLRYQGAHSGGRNNVGNIGVCLLGNFEQEQPSSPALESLAALLAALRERHDIPLGRVVGHRELSPTQCPGTTLMTWVGRYRGAAYHANAR